MRVKARKDANHVQLVSQLRKIGATVWDTAVLKNCCDIVVGYRGKNYLFEIKDPKKTPSQKKLTEGEQKFHETWRGQVNIIETLDDAMKIMEC
jgi:hypothetical protein